MHDNKPSLMAHQVEFFLQSFILVGPRLMQKSLMLPTLSLKCKADFRPKLSYLTTTETDFNCLSLSNHLQGGFKCLAEGLALLESGDGPKLVGC